MQSLVFAATLLAAVAATAPLSRPPGVALGAQRAVDARDAVHDPIGSVQGLISRVLGPEYVARFNISVIPHDPTSGSDVFEVGPMPAGSTARVALRGNSGVSIAAGLGFYLKSLNASWTWGREGSGWQMGTVPAPEKLPVAPATRTVRQGKYSYMYNVCTYGYTTAWWSAAQWQEEIDRLALWGVNLPLAFNGQEYVWLQLYTSPEAGSLNATNITSTFFSGPAFLPWQRMGNIQGWGGGLHESWISGQRDLQHFILAQMRSFGMMPVLPGFAGHIPAALVDAFPTANVTKSASWNNFNSTYSSVYLLQPTDPLFKTLGTKFYELLIAEFGQNPAGVPNFYNADTFNEMRPSSSDPAYLAATNAAIYNAMAAVDPAAVFVMQGWLFVNDAAFWQPAQVKAFLSDVPNEGMLILDLFSDAEPAAFNFESYYGKPFIWNMLQIFGGRRGVYGNLPVIASGPVANRTAAGSSMVGVGATPEATEMTPVTFDLLFEMSWRAESPPLEDWVTGYSARRYGVSSPLLEQAWQAMLPGLYTTDSAYGVTDNLCWYSRAPALTFSTSELSTDPSVTLQALRLFLQAAAAHEVDPSSPTFRYDLVDLARQVACNSFADIAVLAGIEFQRFQLAGVNSTDAVIATQAALLSIVQQVDIVLATDVNFLLGNWLADAAQWSNATAEPQEAANLQFNARNQITLWGDVGQISDYAGKDGWAGLVRDYYMPRWQLHRDTLVAAVVSGVQPNWTAYSAALLAQEQAWNVANTTYPTQPAGDPVELSTQLLNSLAPSFPGSAPPGYVAHASSDIVGGDIMQAWNRDVAVLAWLCSADPSCVGFNSDGWVKGDASIPITPSTATLYLKA